jgi:hypothetical protein
MAKPRTKSKPHAVEIAHALETLAASGAIIVVPETVAGRRLEMVSLGTAADMLSVSTDWMRNHLEEFPQVAKYPGGDIRIPIDDLIKAVKNWRMRKA